MVSKVKGGWGLGGYWIPVRPLKKHFLSACLAVGPLRDLSLPGPQKKQCKPVKKRCKVFAFWRSARSPQRSAKPQGIQYIKVVTPFQNLMDPTPEPYGYNSKTLWIQLQDLKDLLPPPPHSGLHPSLEKLQNCMDKLG